MSIKNGDMPAMPIELSGFGQFAPEAYLGLTKREEFAKAAMQGMCAHSGDWHEPAHMAIDAVAIADALLAELERTK